MLRRLSRLLIILLLLGVIAFVASRLLGGEDDDFDDFDDLDSGFEFQETPVEIDVPANSAPAQDAGGSDATSEANSVAGDMSTGTATYDASAGSAMPGTSGATGATDTTSAPRKSMSTGLLGDMDESDSASDADNNGSDSDRLININGIGSAYEARLQAIGINNVNDLANADAETVASQIDVIGGAATVGDWIDKAKIQQNNGQS